MISRQSPDYVPITKIRNLATEERKKITLLFREKKCIGQREIQPKTTGDRFGKCECFSQNHYNSTNIVLLCNSDCLTPPFTVDKYVYAIHHFQSEENMMHEYQSTEDMFTKRRMFTSRKRLCWGAIAAVVVGFVIGILIGRFGTCPDDKPPERHGAFLNGIDQGIIEDGDPKIGDTIMHEINSENIRKHLQ